MRASASFFLLCALLFFITPSCKQEIEKLQKEPLSDYFPLQTGKYIIYDLDSTVFTENGRNIEIHSYQEKNIVEEQFFDNLGNLSYKVVRSIRNAAGTNPWKPIGTYFITPSEKTIEVVDNHMRVVKLIAPVTEGNTWLGNRYLNSDPFEGRYNYQRVNFLDIWEFAYKNTNDVFIYKQQNLNNVLTVLQVDKKSSLDTLNVTGNKALIPLNSDAVWLRGNATDTIIVTAPKPSLGSGRLWVYNRTNAYASLNEIKIPPGFSLNFEFRNDKWYYPNPMYVVNNRVSVSRGAFLTYILGTATGDIRIDPSNIDTGLTKDLTIYNRSNFNAFINLNPALNIISIPPGTGRKYEFINKEWRFYANQNVLLTTDPYNSELPFGNTSFSVEKYAKGIGMVYQEFLLWEYEPNSAGTAFKEGFGIKRSMVEHN